MASTALTVFSDVLDDLGVVVLTVRGPVDGYTCDLLQKKINQSIIDGQHRIILDLSGVDYISSAGLGVFIAARNKAQEDDGMIVLLNLSKCVREVFKVLSMDDFLNVAASMAEAIEIFQRK